MELSAKELRAVHMMKEAVRLNPTKQAYTLVAAIVGKKGVETIGFNNMKKTHPKSRKAHQKFLCGDRVCKETIHAELHVLTQHKSSLKGKKLVVLRSNGGTSKPCPCCQQLIKDSGIKKVVYVKDGVYIKERY